MTTKIWAHSADSHVLEPPTCGPRAAASAWRIALRARSAGTSTRSSTSTASRSTASSTTSWTRCARRALKDLTIRLKDLDQEGVWSQLAFPSMGFWTVKITDPELARATVARAWNDWAHAEIMRKTGPDLHPRVVSTGRRRRRGGRARARRGARLPGRVPALRHAARARSGALDMWEPLWAAAERAGHGAGVPHRHRRGERRLPRPRRRGRQLHGDHLSRACGWCRTWWPAARSTAIPTSRSSSPRAAPRGCPRSATGWTRPTASTACSSGPS